MKSPIALTALLIIFNCGGSSALTAEQACDNFGTLKLSQIPSQEHLKSYDAQIGEFPHVVTFESTGDYGAIRVGGFGVLISEKFILTTGGSYDSSTFVILGKTSKNQDDNQEPIRVKAKKIDNHPGYKRHSKYDKIGLIELEEPVELSSRVWPACLNRDSSDAKKELIDIGWGSIDIKRDTYSYEWLLKEKLEEIPLEDCRESYKNDQDQEFVFKESHLCVPSHVKQDKICSGGGAVFTKSLNSTGTRYTLHGMKSFGTGTYCDSEFPDVYTRVSSYVDWIEKIVWP